MKPCWILPAAILAVSCTLPVDDHAPSPASSTLAAAQPAAPSSAAVSAPAPVPFADPEKAFAKAREDLLERYYDDRVGDEELYRAALAGMLERLDPGMKKWNKLLGPDELAELRGDLAGEVVGIGAEIKFDPESGYTDVLGLLPRSAAERAGVLPGDKIVTIDGKLFKGATQADVIAHIRGKAGDPVVLSVLRGDRLVEVRVVRELVRIAAVDSLALPGGAGYVRIRGFSGKTAAAAREALEDLARKGTRSLVVDLRGNQGGSFDEAIATAGLFLPKGTPVVRTMKRGQKEDTAVSNSEPVLAGAPIAVLVNGSTASGAELLAAALQEGRKALVVGSRTFGKWTVQTIDELGNGYAAKYTVGRFVTPGGRSFDGEGMPPDVQVDMDEKALTKAMTLHDPEPRIAADVQLRTAVELVTMRAR